MTSICHRRYFLVGLLAVTSVKAQTGTTLGGNVVTRTNVEYLADLTLDIRDMQDVIGNDDGRDAALAIYLDGKNSEPKVGTRFKLTELSTKLASNGVDKATPQFLFHLYGLSERDITRLSEHLTYADNFVQSAIRTGNLYAPTAALVLNIWMYATHLLFQGLQTCQKRVEADNPSQFDLGTAGFDEFIALWIGTGSNPGSATGASLYALAEESHTLFGGTSDESEVNSQIKSLYEQASAQLSIANVCTPDHPESTRIIWSIATQIISQMQVPLIRQLIVAILEKDAKKTEVYAMAVVPQAAQCRPSAYKRLRDYLMQASPRFDKTKIILRDLQDIYSCFGLTCDDIGTVVDDKGVDIPECIAANPRAPMAQYYPSTDVHSISQIDLDVLQLRILTSLGSFKYGKMWYLYGRNSPVQQSSENDPYQYYSLGDLAVASSRQAADPWYSDFVRYHDNNKYSDKLIRDTFDGTGKWDSSKSVAQRSAVITETSAFMVLYMHFIAQVNDAVNHCKGSGSEGEYDLTNPWDEVAALLIGSLEGTLEGGSADVEDGQLLWSLASRRAFQFQSLNGDGYAKVNARLEDLLYAGKGEIDAMGCTAFEKTVEQIKLVSLVPLIQSVLRYAIQNQELSPSSDSADLALGEVYALAILPIMEAVDPSSAVVVEENMIHQDGVQPTRDGAQAVADAMGNFAVAIGLRCSLLGYTSQAKPCRLHGGSAAPNAKPVLLTMMVASVPALSLLW